LCLSGYATIAHDWQRRQIANEQRFADCLEQHGLPGPPGFSASSQE
jgi:hypothetical protein